MHTAPKRFSLIDFESTRVVNSTGIQRNAILLNPSAMEGPCAVLLSSSLFLYLSSSCAHFFFRPSWQLKSPPYPRYFTFFLHHLIKPFPLSFSSTSTWFNICTQIDNANRRGEKRGRRQRKVERKRVDNTLLRWHIKLRRWQNEGWWVRRAQDERAGADC